MSYIGLPNRLSVVPILDERPTQVADAKKCGGYHFPVEALQFLGPRLSLTIGLSLPLRSPWHEPRYPGTSAVAFPTTSRRRKPTSLRTPPRMSGTVSSSDCCGRQACGSARLSRSSSEAWEERGYEFWAKANVERVVFVQEGLVAAVLFYAQERALGRDDYLFPSRKGDHVTKQRADQIIKKAAKRANLQRNVHAHLFRHGYAINFLNCSGRLDALQE